MKKTILFIAGLAAVVLMASIGCHHNSPTAPSTTPADTSKDTATKPLTADSVLYSFVVFGDDRLDNSDTNMQTSPSTANVPQLNRVFNDILQLSPKPDYVFVLGDLVLGQTTDTTLLGTELRGWRQQYESSPIASSGIRLVVIPGNHEVDGANSSASVEQAWLRNMAPYIVGNNGPAVGGADGLKTDQSRLCYSFDFRDTHLVTLNSDPAGLTSTVPVNWVAQDLSAARTAGAKHLFVLDHKTPYNWTNDGTTSLTIANRNALWSALEANHVEAMISSHNHVYRRFQPSGQTWMVIDGNGGAPLDSSLPTDRNYGFSVVEIMKSGKVILKTYARPFGTNYIDPSPASTYPTTLRDSADISWN